MNIVSPVDFNKLANLTKAIQLIPNEYSRMAEVFPLEPVARGAITFDRTQETTGLLSDTRGSGNKQLSSKDWVREVFSLVAPEFSYSDFITADDIDRVRKVDTADQPEVLADIQQRKLRKLKRLHSQTHEFMRVQALKGITTTPDGITYANSFTEFGVTQKVFNFNFSSATLDVNSICREIIRYLEDNAKDGGAWTGAPRVLVSPQFFDKLISHPMVFEAYNQYVNNNQIANAQVNRDNVGQKRFGREFYHAGVFFEEYRASVGSVKFIEDNVGYGYAEGFEGLFVTYLVPPAKFSTINGLGQETYAWQHEVQRDSQAELESFSSVLPFCKRPDLIFKVTLS